MGKRKKYYGDNEIPTADEEKILDLLRVRYAAPAYAFLPQVRSGTGYMSGVRTADGLAMSLWPSRGLELIGFEVKSYRSDWLSELKSPEKAEEICQFCGRWYVVAGNAKIVDKGELPPKWGLIVVKKGRLYTEVKADPFDDVQPLDLPMVCAILRRVTEIAVPQVKIDAAWEKGFKAADEGAKEKAKHDDKYRKQKIEHLEEMIRDFEKASGVKVDGWDGAKEIGQAVKLVLDNEHTHLKAQLSRFRENIAGLLEDTDKAIAKVEETTPAESPT